MLVTDDAVNECSPFAPQSSTLGGVAPRRHCQYTKILGSCVHATWTAIEAVATKYARGEFTAKATIITISVCGKRAKVVASASGIVRTGRVSATALKSIFRGEYNELKDHTKQKDRQRSNDAHNKARTGHGCVLTKKLAET